VTTDDGDRPVGALMPVRALVKLGSLDPDEVVVEAVHGDVDGGGNLHRTESVPLKAMERRDGTIVFQGAVPCTKTVCADSRSGSARPAPHVENPFEANLLTWWEADGPARR